MAALTWRNVDAPDTGAALQGYRQFSDLFGSAFAGANRALTDFDNAKIDENSNRLMQTLLTEYSRSPDALVADMESGALFENIDPNRLNAEAIAMLGKRPEDLQRFAYNEIERQDAVADLEQQAIDYAQRNTESGWRNADRASMEAAKPMVSQILAAASNADSAAAQRDVAAIQASPEFQKAISGLPPETQAQLAKSPIDLINSIMGLETNRINQEGGRLQNQNTALDIEQGRWSFENQKIDRADENAALAVTDALLSQSMDGPSAVRALESSPEYQRLSPRAKAVARGQLQQTFPGMYSPEEVAMPGGGGGPVNYDQFVVSLESGGDPNARAGTSSATGLYQFTEGTWLNTVEQAKPSWARGMSRAQILAQRTNPARSKEMEQRLRANNIQALRSVGASPTNENVYAMHHFGEAAGKRFAKASNSTPMERILSKKQLDANPYLKGKTRGQAIQNWNRRAGVPSTGGNPRIEGAARAAQLNNNRGAGRWAANLTDESNAAEVAKALRSGQFSNVPESWISERVRDIVKRSEVNGEATLTYAEAGRILADTTNRQQAGYITRLLEGDGDINLGNGYRTDNEALNRRIQDARRGGPQDRAAAMEAVAGQAAQLQAAQQAYSAAQADLQRLYRTGRAGVIAANRPALEAKLEIARRNLLLVQEQAAPALQSTREVEGQDKSWFDGLFTTRNTR